MIFRNNYDYKRHINKKNPCKTIDNTNKDLKIELLEAKLKIEKLKHQLNTSIVNNNNCHNSIDNSTNTNNNNINIQYNSIALTKDNFNVDDITMRDISNEQSGICDIIYKAIKLPNGKTNYVCTDVERSMYNRLTDNGEWEKDPKGEYLRRTIYPKISKKVEQVFETNIPKKTFNKDDCFYTFDQKIDLLVSKNIVAYPSDVSYQKVLKQLGSKVYVERKKLKNYLNEF